MRNFCLLIIFIILFPTFYFSSCAKDDSDDKQEPTVSDVAFNVNDTLWWYGDDPINPFVIKLNDSIEKRKNPKLVDTVVIGKWFNVSARLQDNYRLSTFKVKGELTYKSTNIKYKDDDSIFKIERLGQNIFGVRDTSVVRNRLIQITDTLFRNKKRLNEATGEFINVRDTVILEEGVNNFYVLCIDMAGKVNLDSLKPYPIQILRRQTVMDARLK